jgi:hypothetical protein
MSNFHDFIDTLRQTRVLHEVIHQHIYKYSAVDRESQPRSGQPKTIKMVFRRKNKDCLARNQDNVSKWGGMFLRGQLFQ